MMRPMHHLRGIGLVLLTVVVSACTGVSPTLTATPTQRATPTPTPTPEITPDASGNVPTPSPQETATVIAVGDIASCEAEGDSATAAVVADLEGTLVTLGDNVYEAGSDQTYRDCYDPVYGQFKDRTRPAPGNHDVRDDGGDAYFRYFGDSAGAPGEGWYTFDLGAWHLIALNSNCDQVGCGEGSAQYQWLIDDLAANSDSECTLAYWHHARFSSGPHGDIGAVADLWRALDEADADLVLAGHDHIYERFAPQASDGATDPNGLVEITVGTGGAIHHETERVAPNSEIAITDAYGVLVLTLHPDGWDWSFLETDGSEGDAGSASCH
jgi:hypothetical protein